MERILRDWYSGIQLSDVDLEARLLENVESKPLPGDLPNCLRKAWLPKSLAWDAGRAEGPSPRAARGSETIARFVMAARPRITP